MDNQQYLAQVVAELSKPLEFKWKLQSYTKKKDKALCVAYIDSRTVTKRLNEVAVYGWHREHFSIGADTYCRLGLVMPDNTIQWRSDVGESDNATEKAKTSSSDSYKRAAINFGLGLFLYDMDIITLPVVQDGNYYNIVKPDGSKVYDLTKYINEEYKKSSVTTPQATPKVTPTKTEVKKEQNTLNNKPNTVNSPINGNSQATSALQPSKEFTDDAAKDTALGLFKKLDQPKLLKHLIAVEKLKYTDLSSFIKGETIEKIREIYTRALAIK